ncbi:hypothetical protein ACFL08_04270 [Patescibacteria group bacterium]
MDKQKIESRLEKLEGEESLQEKLNREIETGVRDMADNVFFDNDFLDEAAETYQAEDKEDRAVAGIELIQERVVSEIKRRSEELLKLDEEKRAEEIKRISLEEMENVSKEIGNKRWVIRNGEEVVRRFNISKGFAELAEKYIKDASDNEDITSGEEGVKDEISESSDKSEEYELTEEEDRVIEQIEKESIRENIIKYIESTDDLMNALGTELDYFKKEKSESEEQSQKAQEIFDRIDGKFKELKGDFEYIKVHEDELRKMYHRVSDAIVSLRMVRGKESRADFEAHQDSIKKGDLIRRAAEITLDKIDNYEQLNAENLREGDDKFKELTRKAWTDLAVHGKWGKIKGGKQGILPRSDMDGKSSLLLFKEAGIDTSNVEYIEPGDKRSGKINIDTGGGDGLVIVRKEDGSIDYVLIDHHGPESKQDKSATVWTYEILTGLGLLKKERYLDRLVDFVNQEDNYNFRDADKYHKNYFRNSWKTLMGLRGERVASITNLVNFFKYKTHEGKELSVNDEISTGLLKKFGFIFTDKKTGKTRNKSEEQRKVIETAKKKLEKMEKDGFIIETERYGKVAINLEANLLSSYADDALMASGCDTRIGWSPNVDRFSFSSLVGKDIEDEFSQGLNVRGTMWVKPAGPLVMSLEEVLTKMTDGKVEFKGELAKYLEKEKKERELSQEDEKNLDEYYLGDILEMMEMIESTDYEADGYDENNIDEVKELSREFVYQEMNKYLIEEGVVEPKKMENAINYLKNKINI